LREGSWLRRIEKRDLDTTDIEDYVIELTKIIADAALEAIPKRHRTQERKHWWSNELTKARREAIRSRRRIDSHRRKFGSAPELLYNHWKVLQRKYGKAILDAKKKQWLNFLEETNSTNLWTNFKRVTKARNPLSLDTVIDLDGNVIEDSTEIAKKLSEKFFPLVGTPTTIEVPQRNCCEGVPPVTTDEVIAAVNSGKRFGAPGYDGFPNAVLRQCLPLLLPILKTLFTECLRKGFHPKAWKCSVVIPVPKGVNRSSKIELMRPISLLPCLGKTLETIVTRRLTYHIETQGLLSDNQFGFRKGKSTIDALQNFIDSVEEAVKNNLVVRALSLDIKAAFDSVPSETLVQRIEALPIPNYLKEWSKSFISDRIASIQINDRFHSYNLKGGCPQGSPISPILFAVVIDPILRLESQISGLKSQAFAGDLILWSATEEIQSAQVTVQEGLNAVSSQLSNSGLLLSTRKCVSITFMKKTAGSTIPRIRLGNGDLEEAPVIKYLGLFIQKDLNWRTHVQASAAKASKRLQTIQRLTNKLSGLDPFLMRTLTKAAIEPILYYGAPIWGGSKTARRYLDCFDKIIRRCGLLITGCLRTTSYPSVFRLSGL